MTSNDIERITEGYYSCFCGTDVSELPRGTHFICTPRRDEYLGAFGCKYTIWLLEREGLCAAAYSPKHEALVEKLKQDVGDIASELGRQLPLKRMKLMVFEGEKAHDYRAARALGPDDYPMYEAFFREAYPNADPDGWLREYFTEKASGCFTGYIAGGRLVSVCDLPDMPYMQGKIQHTGIKTLGAERRKGYGLCAAALAAHNLLERGVVPQWECGEGNTASVGIARAIGYREYGTAYILEE